MMRQPSICEIGDVVRVPLGTREVLAYIVREPYDAPPDAKRKAVRERLDVPRAFNAEGLHLARFVAEYYIMHAGRSALGGRPLRRGAAHDR